MYFRKLQWQSQHQEMSGNAVAEGGENMARKLENLMKEWKEKVATSVEVQRASDNLELHKQKMNRLVEELSVAEAWEGELKAKRRRIEESLKPPLLQLFDKLEEEEHVDDELLQEVFLSGKEEVFQILERKVRKVKQMERVAGLLTCPHGVTVEKIKRHLFISKNEKMRQQPHYYK